MDGRPGRATAPRPTTPSISPCRRPSSSGPKGTGLRRLVREACDHVAAIPMAGRVSSLNVSVATAIVLFEAVRQRRRAEGQHPG